MKRSNMKYMLNLKMVLVCLLTSLFFNQSNLLAQTPGTGIFFQAIARDQYTNPAKDRKIYVEASIIQASATGTKVLIETHQTTTDGSGVFSISVGQGTRTGGTATGLDKVEWAKGPYYLNLKISITPIAPIANWDYTKEWIDLGTSPFGTVPYALYSGSSGALDDKLSIADTAKMLAIYAKSQVVNNLSTQVNSKLSASDTATMLAPYAKMVNEIVASNITSLTAATVNSALNSKVNIADSGKIYVTPLQLKGVTFDTTSLISKINRKVNLADSTMVFVTPSQLAAKTFDSTAIYTQLASKLNKVDTSTLSNRINLKANTTDVTSGLALKANTTDVTSGLALKANTTDVTSGLALKANTTDVTSSLALKLDASQKGAASGVASLDANSKVPASQIPVVSFQSANVVASQAAMLGLSSAVIGSIAIRTDNTRNYVLSGSDPAVLANWVELAVPTSVTTINGIPGAFVTLTTNEIGEGTNNKYYTDTRVRNAISASAPLNYNAATGTLTMTAASANSNGYLSSSDFTTFNNKQNALVAGTDYATPSGNITGNAANVTGIVSIVNGGTGTSTATGALTTLGAEARSNKSTATDLGNTNPSDILYPSQKAVKTYVDLQSANAGVADLSITNAKLAGSITADKLNGSIPESKLIGTDIATVGTITSGIWSATTIALNKGGTGATTAADARTNLGLVIGTNVMAANAVTTLTGDVAGSGNGSFATTVNSVGGVSSATIATLPTSINTNTASITANTTSINNETTRATNAESALDTRITSNTSSITANTNSITTNTADILLRAPLASPAFIGVPTAPTPATSDNSTKVATTEYVKASITAANAGISSIGDISGTSNAKGAVISGTSELILTPANANFGGIVTTATQTFAGAKTFTNTATFGTDITVNGLTVGKGGGSNLANTAIGSGALALNTSGSGSTAFGYKTLSKSTAGYATAFGTAALENLTTGTANVAIGYTALNQTSSQNYNTAVGDQAMRNSTGANNTVLGASALSGVAGQTNGNNNTALGTFVLRNATTAAFNVGVGSNSLNNLTTGNDNTVLGYLSGYYAGSGTSTNLTSMTQGVLIGSNVRTGTNTSTNEIAIGYNVLGNGSNTVTIGNNSITANYFKGDINLTGNVIGGTWSGTTIGSNFGGAGSVNGILKANGSGVVSAAVAGTDYQSPLSAGSGISINAGTISATGLTTANLSSTAAITNTQLANSTTTLGNTTMTLGGTVTSVTGLNSLAATNLTGDLTGNVTGNVTGNLTGNASTATALATGRTISTLGDVTYTSGSFDGTANVTGTATLTNTTVTAGSYGSSTAIPTFTVDSKGRLTAASTVGITAGVSTLNYTNTTSYAAGGTISGTSLTLTAADGTNPGLISTGAQTIAGAKTFNSNIIGNLTGNASTATTLATSRNINGIAFDGSANITIAADANTLTGTTLASNVISSSLTSVGTITSGIWSGTAISIAKGGTGLTTLGTSGQVLTSNGTTMAWANDAGIQGLNGLTATNQTFTTSTLGNTFTITSNTGNHEINIPVASLAGVTGGLISNTEFNSFSNKQVAYTNLTRIGSLTNSGGFLKNDGSGTFTYASPSKTDVGLALVENIAIGTWTGSTNLTTVGTINTGTWAGSVIADDKITTTLTGKTYNGLTLTSVANGFTIAGGTNSKTITVANDANVSGTNTGDQTITLTGDVTATGTGTFAATLTNTTVTAGSYGSSTAIPTFTVDSKGRLTAASTVGITAGVSTLNYTTTSSYAAGGTISGTSLTLTAADGTNPGLISTGAQTIAGAKTFNSNIIGNLTGNASTATTLATSRNINGTAFNGSADITIAADANTLTGTTLASNVVNSSLTSVGTITTGVWSGTAIAIAKGGTGATTKTAAFDALSPMTTSGDIIYGGASGTGTRLAKGTDGQVLTLASGIPSWAAISAVTSLGTFTTTAYTAGGTINGSTLTLSAADGTKPGLVSTVAQTIAGAKTFSADIFTNNDVRVGKGVAGNTSNTVIGKLALGGTSTVTNENVFNTAIGISAMQNSSGTGSYNTAVGANSAFFNNSGSHNTYLGYQTGYSTTSGTKNVAIGSGALYGSTTGNYLTGEGNNAIGFEAMKDISTTASDNIAIGLSAGTKLTTGTKNIFIGSLAGKSISTGSSANTTGLNSVLIGYDVRPNANADDNEIVISGYNGTAGTVGLGSNTTLIGSSTTTNARIMGALNLPSTTTSSSTTTGALTVGGGAGIAGNINVGGTATISSTLSAGATTLASSSITGNETVGGTLGVTGATTLSSLTASGTSTLTTLTTTGAATFSSTVKITTGAGLGKVLTSDANGNATWKSAVNAVTRATLSSGGTTNLTTDQNYYIVLSGSVTGQTINLPDATANTGKEYTIKNLSAYSLTITATGGKLVQDNSTTASTSALVGIEPSNNWIKVISDGTDWIIFRALF